MQFALLVAASTALLATSVNAHGYLNIAKFNGEIDTTYNAKIDSSTLPAPYAGKKWNDNPTANAKTFADAFKASGEKSIRAMMDKAAPDCGKTILTGTPVDVSKMKSIKWANDQEKMGFVTSHTGPCETYINDVMVQQDMECVSKYPGYPATIPIDFSACKDTKCTLTFYWLALHEPMWQVYKQCAPISNGGSGGGGAAAGGSSSAGNSTSPVPAPATPSANSNTNPNPAPAPASPSSPSNPAPAPAPGKKPGCKRRN